MGIFLCCKKVSYVIQYSCHHDFATMGCEDPLHEASMDENDFWPLLFYGGFLFGAIIRAETYVVPTKKERERLAYLICGECG